MNIKTILIPLMVLLITANSVSATFEVINETMYIYNETSSYLYTSANVNNIDKVIVESGTCSAGTISINSFADYDIEYALHYAPNESVYYTVLFRTTQTEYDGWLWGMYKKMKRTFYIDGVEVASYNLTLIANMGTSNTIKFKTLDQTLVCGSKTITNTTLFFSELVCTDAYNHLNNSTGYIEYKFKTIGDADDTGYSRSELGGFAGALLSQIRSIPLLGVSLYNTLYPIFVLLQYSIDFSFFILDMIINDWWYALLLLECACLFMASQQSSYVNIMSTYIKTHVDIILVIYHKIVLPLLTLSISLLNTLKALIKWW